MSKVASTSKPDVRAVLARVLLTREIGQRIPTVQQLQADSHAGTGTVVKALRELESVGSVKLTSHGHKGTVIVDRHVGQLWNEAGFGNFHLLMPPPGPIEQRAILDVVQTELARAGVPVVVGFLAGSEARHAELFHERAHAAVTSSAAHSALNERYPGLRQLDLGPGSYYAPESLVVVTKPGRPLRGRLRVGIDRGSFDHQGISEREFADVDADWIECMFSSAPAAVLRDDVDAVIWHSMPTVIPPELAGLQLTPIASSTMAAAGPETSAVVLTRSRDSAVDAVLRNVTAAGVAVIRAELARQAADLRPGDPALWPR